ncbi:MAG: hypothetical protein C4332_03680 [Meiothermus sp.]
MNVVVSWLLEIISSILSEVIVALLVSVTRFWLNGVDWKGALIFWLGVLAFAVGVYGPIELQRHLYLRRTVSLLASALTLLLLWRWYKQDA